jgi:hypothetical protein
MAAASSLLKPETTAVGVGGGTIMANALPPALSFCLYGGIQKYLAAAQGASAERGLMWSMMEHGLRKHLKPASC